MKGGMQTGRHRRWPRLVATIMLAAVGVALVLYPLAGNLIYQMTASDLVSSYDASLEGRSQEELDALWDEACRYNDDLGAPEVRDPWSGDKDAAPLDRYEDVLDPDGTGVMGYVEVGAAGIMLPVYHGVSDEVLQEGVGHIPTTALPVGGRGTHAVLTAHTGLPDKMLFTNLSRVSEGDVFTLHVLGRELNYEVVLVSVIEPDDTSLLQPVADEELVTLFTCTPYGVNSHRLIVTGVPVDIAPVDAGMSAWIPLLSVSVTLFLILAIIVALAMRNRAKRRRNEARDMLSTMRRDAVSAAVTAPDSPAGISAAGAGGAAPGPRGAWESGAGEAIRRGERDLACAQWAVRACTAAVALTALLLVLSLWASAGALMVAGLLPYFDLGYAWFDAHVFFLFGA